MTSCLSLVRFENESESAWQEFAEPDVSLWFQDLALGETKKGALVLLCVQKCSSCLRIPLFSPVRV